MFRLSLLLLPISLASSTGCDSAASRAFDAFQNLLQGYEGTEADFLANRSNGPFLLKGNGRSFEWLFSIADMPEIINPIKEHPKRIRTNIKIKYDEDLVLTRWTKDKGKVNHNILVSKRGAPADGKMVNSLYKDGWSIIFLKPYRFLRSVFQMTSTLEQHTLFPVSMYLFVTPPHAQGFDFHYDSTGAFQLQIEGSKRWSVFPPLFEDVTDPLEQHPVAEANAPAWILDGKQEFVIEEGDVLWVPKGWYHRATAIGSKGSVHLSVSPEKLMWGEVFDRLNLIEGIAPPRSEVELEATQGLPLPLRREVAYGLARMSSNAFKEHIRTVARELGFRRAQAKSESSLAAWKDDFVANLTEDLMPSTARYPETSLNGLPLKRDDAEISKLNLKTTTPLRIVTPMAARVMSTKRRAKGQAAIIVKYSTGNSPQRYERASKPWILPEYVATSLRNILHVELNPSGKFTPEDIRGASTTSQIRIARGLLERRIAVLESEWCGLLNSERTEL